MAWTNPRTWSTSEVVTAAMMNTHVRDNMNFLRAHQGCALYKSANQTIPSGNNDLLTWNSESYDTAGFHDLVTNNSRITIPTGYDGYYLFQAQINHDADGANHATVIIRLRKNAAGASGGGTLVLAATFTGHTNAASDVVVWTGPLIAADHLELFYTSNGEARDIVGGAASDSRMSLVMLGN